LPLLVMDGRQSRHKHPRVSVGLPVRNGGQLIGCAIESFLTQSFYDFELIISDNASTDQTESICRQFAAQDERVRYFRWNTNRGASANFNRVFDLARGEYFKWAAHDDWCASDYLERCVETLDKDPTIVLCQSRARLYSENNELLGTFGYPSGLASARPETRFRQILWRTKYPFIFFGLIPSRLLAQTKLLGRDTGSDRILLGELSLLGRIVEIPEPLFCSRQSFNERVLRNRLWWSPDNRRRLTLRTWRLTQGFSSLLLDSQLSPMTRYELILEVLARYGVRDAPRMGYDLLLAGRQLLSHHEFLEKSVRSSPAQN